MSLSFEPAAPAPARPLQRFLAQLFEEGVVEIPMAFPSAAELAAEDEQVEARLAERAAEIAPTLAPPTPVPCLATARWAAQRFYFATFAYVHRETSADELRAGLSVPPPAPPEVAGAGDVDLGADLVFCFAPDLVKMARATASADPLVEALVELLAAWPLSSVGIGGTAPAAASPSFWSSPSLRTLYIDRVIARGDRTRLASPPVSEAVRAALGAHPELGPELVSEIDPAAAERQSPADVETN